MPAPLMAAAAAQKMAPQALNVAKSYGPQAAAAYANVPQGNFPQSNPPQVTINQKKGLLENLNNLKGLVIFIVVVVIIYSIYTFFSGIGDIFGDIFGFLNPAKWGKKLNPNNWFGKKAKKKANPKNWFK